MSVSTMTSRERVFSAVTMTQLPDQVAAIFLDDVPADYLAAGGEYLNLPAKVMPDGEVYIGEDVKGNPVRPEHMRRLEPGEEVDFRGDIELNRQYFAN